MSLEKYPRPLGIGGIAHRLGDACHMLPAEGDEILRLLLATGDLPEERKARLKIAAGIGEKVDEDDLDAGGLELGELRLIGAGTEGEDRNIRLGCNHAFRIEGAGGTWDDGKLLEFREGPS